MTKIMSYFNAVVQTLTNITKWLGVAVLFLMMLFMTAAVIAREMGHPILGDVEIVQFIMVLLIMLGLAYAQSINAHIAIGLIVDRFNQRVQSMFDVIAYTLTFLVCLLISWVYIGVAIEHTFGTVMSTQLLSIPFYPFEYVIAFGFFLWGMEALLKVIKSLISFFDGMAERVDERVNG